MARSARVNLCTCGGQDACDYCQLVAWRERAILAEVELDLYRDAMAIAVQALDYHSRVTVPGRKLDRGLPWRPATKALARIRDILGGNDE